jgi:AcrR family transcriptional regulator
MATGADSGADSSGAPLRADAARNVAQIRAAAIDAFHGRGLSTPLEEIAAAAGVSKGTIYARFGGRAGLIDAVIGELVASELYAIMDRALEMPDPWKCVAGYIAERRDLQYREPAFTDALLMTHPDSKQLVALAKRATMVSAKVLRQGRAAGAVRPDFTAGDLYYADVANGLALRIGKKPSQTDHDRRTRFFLDSIRAR